MKTVLSAAIVILCCACDPVPPVVDPDPTGPIPDTGISLSETACFGTCPVYSVTVYPNEFYQLDLGRFTRAPDTMETGVFPAGTFAAASRVLRTASFATLPTDITIGSPACGDRTVSDLPRAQISEVTIAGPRIIDYYPGCFGAPDRPALDTMLSGLRRTFGIPALVEP